MVPLLFLLVSRQLSVLAVAECLSRARFGFWSEDRRTFFPELSQAAAFGVQRFGGGFQTKEVRDLGVVVVSFCGSFDRRHPFCRAVAQGPVSAWQPFNGQQVFATLGKG